MTLAVGKLLGAETEEGARIAELTKEIQWILSCTTCRMLNEGGGCDIPRQTAIRNKDQDLKIALKDAEQECRNPIVFGQHIINFMPNDPRPPRFGERPEQKV
jgi:hypothetical protein